MPYVPREGTLPQRVCEYFHQVPSEELTAAEIAKKFDVPATNVAPGLTKAVENRFLEVFQNTDQVKSYRAGPELKSVPRMGHSKENSKPLSPFNVWLKGKGEASAEGRPKPAPLPDPTAIKIEKGVALPPPPAPKPKKATFTQVFAQMQAGDSFSIDADAGKRVIQAAGRYAKGKGGGMKFSLRQFGDGSARIWRVA